MAAALILGLLLQGLAFAQLPGGTLEDKPRSYEVESRQIGGSGWSNYSAVKSLRCGSDEAIVGIRIYRGSLINSFQVVCAQVSCGGGACKWSSSKWGPWAGSSAKGSELLMMCRTGSAVAGFRAMSDSGDRSATDFAIACSEMYQATPAGSVQLFALYKQAATSAPKVIDGRPPPDASLSAGPSAPSRTAPQKAPPPRPAPPVAQAAPQPGAIVRATPEWVARATPIAGAAPVLGICQNFAATAMSVAVTAQSAGGNVAAISMFCGNARGLGPGVKP